MNILCGKCGERKQRGQFPKQHTSWCLACLRIYTKQQRAAKGWAHGVGGYKNHGCRCDICRMAWSEKMHAAHLARQIDAQIAANRPALDSWWTRSDLPREGWTKRIEAEELTRMRSSRFGQGSGRPFNSDELSPK